MIEEVTKAPSNFSYGVVYISTKKLLYFLLFLGFPLRIRHMKEGRTLAAETRTNPSNYVIESYQQ